LPLLNLGVHGGVISGSSSSSSALICNSLHGLVVVVVVVVVVVAGGQSAQSLPEKYVPPNCLHDRSSVTAANAPIG
jgi:hypothetical protein